MDPSVVIADDDELEEEEEEDPEELVMVDGSDNEGSQLIFVNLTLTIILSQ